MKVLIVDDEKLTQEGLFQEINWERLNIQEVLLASDGLEGIVLARTHRPDIVLSDIRMPRMNGIEMAEQIQNMNPDTCIVFMSGYSDKEYLKAAIRLRAVNYVEKPIVNKEVEQALADAIATCEKQKYAKTAIVSEQQKRNHSLALFLTSKQDLFSLDDSTSLDFDKYQLSKEAYYTTFIVSFHHIASPLSEENLNELYADLDALLKTNSILYLHAIKNGNILIFHIYGNEKPSESNLMKLAIFLKEKLNHMGDFFTAIGRTVQSYLNVYDSYSSAVFLLQSSFFNDSGAILTELPPKNESAILKDLSIPYFAALIKKDRNTCEKISNELFETLKSCQTLLPNQAKDMYYKYFVEIQNYISRRQENATSFLGQKQSIWESISKCNTLKELHQLFEKQQSFAFDELDSDNTENSIIHRTKDFIHNNYSSIQLSVKEISDHVHLSSSYICTLFKNETGQTINQYLTDYRLKTAKYLLSEQRYKVSDISTIVGYEHNYFCKLFKKTEGLSPTQYREKILK